MSKRVLPSAVVCSALLCLTSASFAAVVLPSNRNIDIKMSNDNGARYGTGVDDTYRIVAGGGGLNQLHIAADSTAAGVFGQVTTQNVGASFSATGTFWISTTGGRGYNDDVILMFSLQGPIGDDFSLSVKSSGYQWTASNSGVVNPIYKQRAVDETFSKEDFLYGPHTAKPGPGNGWTLPFYSGQNINDPATEQYLMFVDLNVGNTNIRPMDNTDDHEKNHVLLMDDAQHLHLAPAFDVLPTGQALGG